MFAIVFASVLFTLASSAQIGDSFLQTSVNGNIYNLTTIGKSYLSLPYPSDEVELKVTIAFKEQVLQINYSSMELLNANSSLVDLIYIDNQPHVNFTGSKYYIPGNLPSDYYIIRINTTYTGSIGDQNETVILSPFEIDGVIACSDLPTYDGCHPISDPNFSSLHITTPYAGEILEVVTTGPNASNPNYAIGWDYYNAINAQGHGI
ncbi:hypothetical protein FRB93_012845 [Tulasnella sp. JGI-2019a]|nr:hypothetical protein FRB93_012845 [Tulasnella sp. JGI-2019a]